VFQPEKVERALFQWDGWRHSIIYSWIHDILSEPEGAAGESEPATKPMEAVKLAARREMQRLGFPGSLWLDLYWICCIASDYSLDDTSSFENIVIPDWLPLPFDEAMQAYQLRPRMRSYPPAVCDEADILFEVRHYGRPRVVVRLNFFRRIPLTEFYGEHERKLLLSPDHELWDVLKKMRGRPKKRTHQGRRPFYSDRLAVRCAVLKDQFKETYVEIANELDLPVRKPSPSIPVTKPDHDYPGVASYDRDYYPTEQSTTARHLVARGRKLIGLLGE